MIFYNPDHGLEFTQKSRILIVAYVCKHLDLSIFSIY